MARVTKIPPARPEYTLTLSSDEAEALMTMLTRGQTDDDTVNATLSNIRHEMSMQSVQWLQRNVRSSIPTGMAPPPPATPIEDFI